MQNQNQRKSKFINDLNSGEKTEDLFDRVLKFKLGGNFIKSEKPEIGQLEKFDRKLFFVKTQTFEIKDQARAIVNFAFEVGREDFNTKELAKSGLMATNADFHVIYHNRQFLGISTTFLRKKIQEWLENGTAKITMGGDDKRTKIVYVSKKVVYDIAEFIWTI